VPAKYKSIHRIPCGDCANDSPHGNLRGGTACARWCWSAGWAGWSRLSVLHVLSCRPPIGKRRCTRVYYGSRAASSFACCTADGELFVCRLQASTRLDGMVAPTSAGAMNVAVDCLDRRAGNLMIADRGARFAASGLPLDEQPAQAGGVNLRSSRLRDQAALAVPTPEIRLRRPVAPLSWLPAARCWQLWRGACVHSRPYPAAQGWPRNWSKRPPAVLGVCRPDS
jgi:hypothetical protein